MIKSHAIYVKSFLKGMRDGLAAPFSDVNPPRVRTKIDRRVIEPSYRPPSEDALNIQRDFEKALAHVRKDLPRKQN